MFKSWFINRLDQSLAESLPYMAEAEAIARLEATNALAERWGVTGLPADEERAGNELLAALANRSRVDDDTAEHADPAEPATLVLWIAEVRCEVCGSPLAQATARSFDLVLDGDGIALHADPIAIEYLPSAGREGGLLTWPCIRCAEQRQVPERRSRRIIRNRWLKRSRSLGASATPLPHTVILASASTAPNGPDGLI